MILLLFIIFDAEFIFILFSPLLFKWRIFLFVLWFILITLFYEWKIRKIVWFWVFRIFVCLFFNQKVNDPRYFNIFNYFINLFHATSPSCWPFCCSIIAICRISSIVVWIKFSFIGANIIFFSFFALLILRIFWWYDLSLESKIGEHTYLVNDNISFGIILFILREVFFFAGFFWRFFHYSLNPNFEIGRRWPPIGCNSFNPFTVPFLNTMILLRSGVTVTFSHHLLINNEDSEMALFWTIILGIYFTILQIYEYLTATFTMCDRRYGSIFFIATGFHGLHVFVGTCGLLFSCYQLTVINFSSLNHLSYEFVIWYWHFVDVVWLFLFTFIYWWGQWTYNVLAYWFFRSKENV